MHLIFNDLKNSALPLQSSKYSSKRDYERDRSSNYRDRDLSPTGGGPLNNGKRHQKSLKVGILFKNNDLYFVCSFAKIIANCYE